MPIEINKELLQQVKVAASSVIGHSYKTDAERMAMFDEKFSIAHDNLAMYFYAGYLYAMAEVEAKEQEALKKVIAEAEEFPDNEV